MRVLHARSGLACAKHLCKRCKHAILSQAGCVTSDRPVHQGLQRHMWKTMLTAEGVMLWSPTAMLHTLLYSAIRWIIVWPGAGSVHGGCCHRVGQFLFVEYQLCLAVTPPNRLPATIHIGPQALHLAHGCKTNLSPQHMLIDASSKLFRASRIDRVISQLSMHAEHALQML